MQRVSLPFGACAPPLRARYPTLEEHKFVDKASVSTPVLSFPSYELFTHHIDSTFHVSTAEGPVVLLLVSAVPLENDPDGHSVLLTWRGPRLPRLPDCVVLYHPVIPPLQVRWSCVSAEPKQIVYKAAV